MQTDYLARTKRCNIAFGGMQGLYYAANCIFFGFLISYLSYKGYSYIVLGMVSTVIAASTMIFQPVLGYVMDSFITPKKLLVGMVIVSLPVSVIFFAVDESRTAAFLIIALMSFLQNTLAAVIDSWCVRLRESGLDINYPVTRSMGSIFYSFSALLVGFLISWTGYLVIAPGYIIASVLFLVFVFMADDVECKNKSEGQNVQTQRISLPKAFKILMGNFDYRIFIISYFFYSISMRVVCTFIANIISERGGTSAHLGAALFIAAFFELPLLLVFSKYAKRMRLPLVYIAALLLGLVRVVSLNIFPTLGMAMFSQFFQGFSFGLCIPFVVEYVNEKIDENLKATAITIAMAVAMGAALIIGNSLGGVIIDRFGMTGFGVFVVFCMIVALVVFGVPYLLNKKQKE